MIFVGDDWAEAHHDVHVIDESGKRVAAGRFPEGIEGIAAFHATVAELVSDPAEVKVGIETDRGLWVQALVAAGYQVVVFNPLAVARYRKMHHLAGGKSDRADAATLANMVRLAPELGRQAAGDTALGEGVKVLARAHQSLIWERTRHSNRLRSALVQYYPTALRALSDLDHPDTLAVLAKAPTPHEGRRLTVTQIKAALRGAGRQRNIERRAQQIRDALRADQIEPDPTLAAAFAAITRAEVAVIAELNRQISELETELDASFDQHPDADIYLSQPGLGRILGARVLGEFGDDPNRYLDAKSRKNYAGSSPITRQSGKTRIVAARWIRNRRLGDALNKWAFSAITASEGARRYYQQRRLTGDTHNQALRALSNRLVGILHGCLKNRSPYDEHTAWAHRQPQTETKAA